MESHHEESMECPCPCHPSGGTCSTCASTGCKMKGGMGGAINPIEIGDMMWQKAFFKANMELMSEKLKKRMEAKWGPATDKGSRCSYREDGKTMDGDVSTNRSRARIS